jgi:hypothetical protein
MGADTVMDVQCRELPRKTGGKLMQQMEQHHRINTTAQPNQDSAMRR